MSKLETSRWTMIRNLIAFQVKLAGDALRDFVLSPVSFVCTLLDIIQGNNQENSYFNRLMNFGKQTDIWLNLFGQHSNEKDGLEVKINTESDPSNVDQLIAKIEALVVEQHANGQFSTNAKTKLSQYLNKLGNKKEASSEIDSDQPH